MARSKYLYFVYRRETMVWAGTVKWEMDQWRNDQPDAETLSTYRVRNGAVGNPDNYFIPTEQRTT